MSMGVELAKDKCRLVFHSEFITSLNDCLSDPFVYALHSEAKII